MKLRIKALRKARDWTQEHVAGLVGASIPHVSEIESGRKNPSISMLEALATAFGVTVSDLFADDRSEIEQELLQIFRRIPAHKHDDLLRILTLAQDPPPRDDSEE